jgi:hypothetical protein
VNLLLLAIGLSAQENKIVTPVSVCSEVVHEPQAIARDSTEEDNHEYSQFIMYNSAVILRDKAHSKANGFSVRCIKDM